MARKLPRLQRVLDAPALASVAYGEVASSIYFALGIVALHALGLTPVVLGVVGVLFLVVTLSYAEGTTTIGEAGGAATFVRVAFNDLAGFVTGWALFLDYLIVIALSALFFPHYLGLALGWHSIAQHPGDVIVGCVLIGAIALVRLLRPTRLYSFSLAVPVLEMMEADRDLDESLQRLPRVARGGHPVRLEHLVNLEVQAGVEEQAGRLQRLAEVGIRLERGAIGQRPGRTARALRTVISSLAGNLYVRVDLLDVDEIR